MCLPDLGWCARYGVPQPDGRPPLCNDSHRYEENASSRCLRGSIGHPITPSALVSRENAIPRQSSACQRRMAKHRQTEKPIIRRNAETSANKIFEKFGYLFRVAHADLVHISAVALRQLLLFPTNGPGYTPRRNFCCPAGHYDLSYGGLVGWVSFFPHPNNRDIGPAALEHSPKRRPSLYNER